MYTLANLDDELSSMALIRALPFEAYGNFRSSLLLMADVSYRTVKSAFLQEARNRQPRASELSMLAAVKAGLTQTVPKQQWRPVSENELAYTAASAQCWVHA